MERDVHIEMTEASNKCAQSLSDSVGVQSLLSIAFCEGVRWADKNPADENQAKKKYRIEVAELAKQIFIHECGIDIQNAFAQAEKFVLSKYSYILTGKK
jgi:hypothetical protein